MANMPGKRSFGALRRLPSGRWQASYVGLDLARYKAPRTFAAKIDAEGWLIAEKRLLDSGKWTSPTYRQRLRPMKLEEYATRWLESRPLKPRTRTLYEGILERHIYPTFGDTPLVHIHREAVRTWHARLDVGATTKAHAYSLLRAIMTTALDDEYIDQQPCQIPGAGQTPRARKIRPASIDEIATIGEHMPPPWQSLVLVSAWCSLRVGEALELRRGDVQFTDHGGILRIRRAVSRVRGGWLIGDPKSAAGKRDVHMPEHVAHALAEHMQTRVPMDPEALLWPSPTKPDSHLQHSTLTLAFRRASLAADRDDLRWHDLRHSGAVLAAQAGGTLAELMGRLGHSTPRAAMIYQHVADGRDEQLAAALSQMASRTPARLDGPAQKDRQGAMTGQLRPGTTDGEA